MSDRTSDSEELELTATDTPSGGGVNEDWVATILGLAILALALLGVIPNELLW